MGETFEVTDGDRSQLFAGVQSVADGAALMQVVPVEPIEDASHDATGERPVRDAGPERDALADTLGAARSDLGAQLCAVRDDRPQARRGEVATVLRIVDALMARTPGQASPRTSAVGGAAHIELGTVAVAERLRREIAAGYGAMLRSGPVTVHGSVVQIPDGLELARVTGLVDRRGRPVRGLPPALVTGGAAAAAGIWRGALLVAVSIDHPRGRAELRVRCPGPEVALALAGAARRLGAAAQPRESERGDLVVVTTADAITTLLGATGAARVAATLTRSPGDPHTHRRRNLTGANTARATAAAAHAARRAAWAVEVLGDQAPEHLAAVGRLRSAHPALSLDELGRRAEPPMSKDTVSGRLRRLLALADGQAGPEQRRQSG